MKTHKLYQLRLKEAEQQKTEVEGQVQKCRAKLHEALLANKIGQAEQAQQILETLQRKLKLAEAKVEAVKGTELKAKEEAKLARQDLEKAQPILKNLSTQLPEEWPTILKQLEDLSSTVDEFTKAYQVLLDRHFEVRFLADLLDEKVTVPPLFQVDGSPLVEVAHRLKMAAQSTTLPNAQIKWQGKIAELQNIKNQELKRKRREETGYKPNPDAFTAVGL